MSAQISDEHLAESFSNGKVIANENDTTKALLENIRTIPSSTLESSNTVNSKQEQANLGDPNCGTCKSNGIIDKTDNQNDDLRVQEDDEVSDVSNVSRSNDISNCRQKKDREEDIYGHLLEQIHRFQEHLPLHKSVCCSLCRKTELRMKKTMQDWRSFSCPDSTDTLDTGPLLITDEDHFTRMPNNAGSLKRPSLSPPTSGLVSRPDSSADCFPDSETDNSSSCCYSPVPCPSVNSDDLGIDTNHSIERSTLSELDESEHAMRRRRMRMKQTTSNPVQFRDSISGVSEADETSRDNESREDETPRDRFVKLSTFRRCQSVKDDGVVDGEGEGRRTFSSRRYESLRLPRNPTADLQPIKDPLLLQRLQQSSAGIQLSRLRLSQKDQKMLARLLAKKEQEREARERRDSNCLHREDVNKRMTSSSSAPLRRQLSLNESRLRNHREKQGIGHMPCSNCQSRETNGHSTGHKSELQWSRHKDNDCHVCRCASHSGKDPTVSLGKSSNGHHHHHNGCDECQCEHQCCSRYATSLVPAAHKTKKQLHQAMERKKQVEQHLKEQKQKTEKYLAQLKEKTEQEQQRATLTRQQKTSQLAEKSRLHNLHAHQKLQDAKESKNTAIKEILNSHEEKKAQLTAAEQKVKQLREKEKTRIESEIHRKLEKSQLKQRQLEDELRQWQTELLEYRQLQEDNSQSISTAAINRKKEAITREREAKERQQKENLTRMLAKENEWKAELEAVIQSKDERSRQIKEEKQKMIQISRDAALTSRRIRDELGLNHSMSELDLVGRLE